MSGSQSRDDVLVTTEWLAAHLHDDGLVVAEVNEDAGAYERGHIPGSVHIEWRRDLQDPVRRDLVRGADFARLLGSLGIAPETTVVLYGSNNNWFATYAYWHFRLFGHDRVKVLDGGRKRWELDGRALVREEPVIEPVPYPVPEEQPGHRARRDEVLAGLGVKQLIDVRTPDEYAGRLVAPAHLPQEQPQRPGHIPTAVNVPWSLAANDDGTFKTDEELAAIYRDAGLDPHAETIAYCRIGERSAHTWFVLHELLGWHDVKNYDGSWTEYGSLVGVPVQLGDEPGSPEGGNAAAALGG